MNTHLPVSRTIYSLLSESSLIRWLYVVLAVGLGWRLLRWAIDMPLWGDEVMLALPLLERDLADLFTPIVHTPLGPVFFNFWNWIAINFLGHSEHVLRLLPIVSSLAGLLLFSKFSRRVLSPIEAVIAVGFLAVTWYTVRHGSVLKPYSLDMFVERTNL